MTKTQEQRTLVHAGYISLITHLEDQIREGWSWPSAEGGFVLLMQPDKYPSLTDQINASLSERKSEAPVLAACGYIAHLGFSHGLSSEEWRHGIERLSGREAITTHRNTFIFRPHEVLGLALGINFYEDVTSPLRLWLSDLIQEAGPLLTNDPIWKQHLMRASATILGGHTGLAVPEKTDITGAAYWLVLQELHPIESTSGERQQVTSALLKSALTSTATVEGVAQSAATRRALQLAVHRVLEPMIEEFFDEGATSKRLEEQKETNHLRASIRKAEMRASTWGQRYALALRVLVLPIAILTALAASAGTISLLNALSFFERAGITAIVATTILILLVSFFTLARNWEKSLANTLPKRFGDWNSRRIRRRWLEP